ncbi:hypothetical protein [Marinobacter salsuginis]|uniref:hypothetical protein n=1 Tax=Marinobacter salsuginis TaxID=418719 RepID=UPI00273E9B80|nr:hypothetical protein [Marinobacter salsuginis]
MTNVTPFQAEKLRAFRAVQAAVEGLPAPDVVDVLTQQLREVARADPDEQPVTIVRLLRDPQRRPCKVELDPELESFILTQSAGLSIEHLRRECIKKFGAERAPSRSGLNRYINRLKYRTKGDRK